MNWPAVVVGEFRVQICLRIDDGCEFLDIGLTRGPDEFRATLEDHDLQRYLVKSLILLGHGMHQGLACAEIVVGDGQVIMTSGGMVVVVARVSTESGGDEVVRFFSGLVEKIKALEQEVEAGRARRQELMVARAIHCRIPGGHGLGPVAIGGPIIFPAEGPVVRFSLVVTGPVVGERKCNFCFQLRLTSLDSRRAQKVIMVRKQSGGLSEVGQWSGAAAIDTGSHSVQLEVIVVTGVRVAEMVLACDYLRLVAKN
jgi:hypothetical protein